MVSHILKAPLGAIIVLGIALIPACLSETPPSEDTEGNETTADQRVESSLDAARHVDEIRSAFRVISPASERDVTPVIGDSVATGYAWTGAGLRAQGVTASEVDFVLPTSADGAKRLQKSDLSISARLRSASPSPAEVAGGYVLYRDALGDRASVIEQARADGVEDFIYFPERPSSEEIVYDIDLEPGVGGLRLVANTLEVLDPAGVPRLRVNPPFAVGADGTVVEAKLDVDGCAVDRNPSIPSAVRTPPGATSCAVRLSWTGVTYPALVDPMWTATSSMAYARVFPASSLVIDTGHVLVSGGYDLTGALTSAEIYDASSGVWIATGSMVNKRYLHRQVLLGTGKVLVTGGNNYTSPYVSSSEEYDPGSGQWIHQKNMAIGRSEFPLVVVSGAPVVLGGWSASGPLAACEKYDPIAHGWSAFPSMATARGGAAAASYGTDAFIVSGGYNYASGYLDSSEVYSAAAGTFWAGAPMTNKRAYPLANAVTGNPKVLITGGMNSTGNLNTAEVYYGSFTFPSPGSWSAITNMSVARHRHQAVNVTSSRVMVCGGVRAPSTPNRSCETFDSLTFGWSPTFDMTAPRDSFTMLLVPSIGKMLAAGGYMLSSAELGCTHDKCTIGGALASDCDPCVSSICVVDPYCCSTSWDSICVGEVRTVCGSLTCAESNGTCGHSLCTTGTSLVNSCDSAKANCVFAICGVDPWCCSTSWDNTCVGEVASVCGKNCN